MSTPQRSPDQPSELDALLSDPNLLASEREAITRLLAATVTHEAREKQEANDCTLDHTTLDAGGIPPHPSK